MAAIGYTAVTGASVALAAATAKSVLGVKSQAAAGLQVKGFSVQFDGITSSALLVLVELCYATFATNSPGTASTSVTPLQNYGTRLAAGFTAAKTWTTEPTVLTVFRGFLVPPDKGSFTFQFPLGTEPDTAAFGDGFVLRCNAPAIVNVYASLDVERI
jgi:hypothetical protein